MPQAALHPLTRSRSPRVCYKVTRGSNFIQEGNSWFSGLGQVLGQKDLLIFHVFEACFKSRAYNTVVGVENVIHRLMIRPLDLLDLFFDGRFVALCGLHFKAFRPLLMLLVKGKTP